MSQPFITNAMGSVNKLLQNSMKNKVSVNRLLQHRLAKIKRDKYIHSLTYDASKHLIELHAHLNAHRILDYGCGQGIGTRILQNKFPKAQVYAVDNDIDLMQTTVRSKLIEYISLSNLSNIRNEHIDLIYSKLFFSRAKYLKYHLDLLDQKLSLGGFLMIEDIQFIESHCSPSNFVFQQGLELFAELMKTQGIQAQPLEVILDHLRLKNYSIGQVIYHRPKFLIGEQRHILSMALKSHANTLIRTNLMHPDKLKQFLQSLITVESNDEHILTLPGIHQIIARKPK